MNAQINRTKRKSLFILIATHYGSNVWNELCVYTSTHLPQHSLEMRDSRKHQERLEACIQQMLELGKEPS